MRGMAWPGLAWSGKARYGEDEAEGFAPFGLHFYSTRDVMERRQQVPIGFGDHFYFIIIQLFSWLL
jgi:hypothetical protein